MSEEYESEIMTKDENIIYQLETLASYDPKDLDSPEFEVAYESSCGTEQFSTVCCVELAKKAIELIERLRND